MNTRSKRQIDSLRHAREWHLSMALNARQEGRIHEHDFHMRHYTLLGPAVEAEGLKEVKADSTQTRFEIPDAEF